jgi:hypothetical protein
MHAALVGVILYDACSIRGDTVRKNWLTLSIPEEIDNEKPHNSQHCWTETIFLTFRAELICVKAGRKNTPAKQETFVCWKGAGKILSS